MREIRFRAWDIENKVMCDVSHIFIANMVIPQTIMVSVGSEMKHCPDDAILMQFTGLLDRHGNEIFEGDVLRFNGEYPMNLDSWMGRRFWEKTGYVYYDDKESRFTCTEMGNQVSTSYWIACSKEVIGNIYENPSLLKETLCLRSGSSASTQRLRCNQNRPVISDNPLISQSNHILPCDDKTNAPLP